ncbi:hypothetical protein [Streptomyces sp. NPDC001843]|uniref:hypothetical protein n=1 Tax=Streptomyces sp. NPDC001843 TaxID=3364617 RepID=UPI00368EDDF6
MTTTAATDADGTGAHPRFAAALDELGLGELRSGNRRYPEATRTAGEAAAAIGGVPPFGQRTRTRVLADGGLLGHDLVWTTAGTPYAVFPMDPGTLVTHAGATLADVRERTS